MNNCASTCESKKEGKDHESIQPSTTHGPGYQCESDNITKPISFNEIAFLLLSCQPRVTVTSCFDYKFIRNLASIYHLCINPILRDKIDLSIRISSSGVYKLMFSLTIVNETRRHCHSCLARQ